MKAVYNKNYKAASRAPKPVSYYINVDIHLPGCPINPQELERLLECVFLGKKFIPAYGTVCLDCKAKNNACLFLDEGFCLGPVTKGGCEAPCPSVGLRCYGCFGPAKDANLKALEQAAKKTDKAEVDRAIRLFFRHTPEYKAYKSKKDKK